MNKNNVENLLKDTDVKIENIDTCLKEQGIIVTVSFGGGRNAYKISPKAFGVKEEELSEESQEFLEKHVRNGSVTFIPKDKYKKLRAIESRTKKKLTELSIGYNNSFMPINSFTEYAKYFNEAKKEYLQIGEELSTEYSKMLNRFKEIVEKSIEDLDAYAAEEEYNRIMQEIPTKEAFKNSFKAEMSISLFPTMKDMEGLDDEIQKHMKEQYEEMGKNLVGDTTVNIINEAFSSLISIFNSDKERGKLHHKIIEGLTNSTKRMAEKNILGNERLDKVRTEMQELLAVDIDIAIEKAEVLLAELYVYAKGLKIQDKVNLKNCPLTAKELETIYKLYN